MRDSTKASLRKKFPLIVDLFVVDFFPNKFLKIPMANNCNR